MRHLFKSITITILASVRVFSALFSIYDFEDDINQPPGLPPVVSVPQYVEYGSNDLLQMTVNEILQDSDPNTMNDVLSEAVRIRETKEKSKLVVRGGKIPGAFSLSFDESPSENTPRLLRVLKKYNRKCGFYIDPFNITRSTVQSVSQMFKDGHTIGLSVCSDTSLTDVSSEESHRIIDQYVNEYSSIIGWLPETVRLPRQGYYSDDIKYCLSNGMNVCEPNIDSVDYANPNFIGSIENSLSYFDPSVSSLVIVLRDAYSYSIDKIDELVDLLVSYGYTFVDYNENTGFKSIKKQSKNKRIGSYLAGKRERSKEDREMLHELLGMDEEHEDKEESSAEKLSVLVKNNMTEALDKKEIGDKKVSLKDKIEEKEEIIVKTNSGSILLKVVSIGGILLVVGLFI